MAETGVCPRCGSQGEQRCPTCKGATVRAVIAGRFQINALSARDALGTRFRGEELTSHAPVNIRLGLPLSDVNTAHFTRHAAQLNEILHHNLPRLLHAGVHGDHTPVLVTEALDGETLGEHLAQRGPIPVPRAMSIATQVLKALHELHSVGVVHGNVDAATVFLVRGNFARDEVRLMDAGLPPDAATAEVTGDLHDVGALLHEMLTGRPPATDGAAALRDRPDVYDIVDRLLASDPERRPVSALHAITLVQKLLPVPVDVSNADLMRLQTQEFSLLEAERQARLQEGSPERRSGPSRVVVALIVGLLLGAGVMYMALPNRPTAAKRR